MTLPTIPSVAGLIPYTSQVFRHPSAVHHDTVPISFTREDKRVPIIPCRYVSIVLLTVSNVGYFYHGFPTEVCSTYYLISPALKGELFNAFRVRYAFTPYVVVQIMISQAIVGYRTWNIAQRSKRMGVILFSFGFAITALEWYANLGSRTPLQKDGK